MGLDTRTRKVNIVIRNGREIPRYKLKAYCDFFFESYAAIVHQGDIQPETKQVEPTHYHIVGDLIKDGKEPRLSTTLNKLTTFFEFPSAIGIEIQKYTSLEGSIQYLIHKNDKDKTQHEPSEIISNYDSEELKTILDSENTALSVDRLWLIVSGNMSYDKSTGQVIINYKEIARALGFGNLQSKRMAIEWAIKDTERILLYRHRYEIEKAQ